VEGLRTDQAELLTRHREIAFELFTEAAISFESPPQLRDAPEGRALLDARRETQVAIAVCAAAAAVERRRMQQERARNEATLRLEPADVFPTAVLGVLKRRRLPLTSADVELLLDLATSTMQPDDVFGRKVASVQLERAATYFRSRLERQQTERPQAVTPEHEAWLVRLEADAL
jgi:hypothetical protein